MLLKNILFVVSTMQQGGAERVVSVMANNWAKLYNVSIISFDDKLSSFPIDKSIKYYNLNSAKKRSSFFTIFINNYKLSLIHI